MSDLRKRLERLSPEQRALVLKKLREKKLISSAEAENQPLSIISALRDPALLSSFFPEGQKEKKEPITIRPYRDGDEKEINELFNRVFGRSRTLEEWHWKFKENPILNNKNISDFITVIEKDGRIVGHDAKILVNVTYKDDTRNISLGVDTMLAPDVKAGIQSLGMLFTTQLATLSAIPDFGFFGLGFPNKNMYLIGKMLFNSIDFSEMIVLFKKLSLKGGVKRRFSFVPDSVLNLIHIISRPLYRVPLRGKKSYTIEQVETFDERIDRLWEKVKGRFGITIVRTHEYLNWRYRGAIFLIAKQGKEIAGYLIARLEKRKDGQIAGKLLDILYDHEDVATFLISMALQCLFDHDADYALCGFLQGDSLEKTFKKAGFIEKKGYGSFPVACFLDPEKVDRDYVLNPANWHLVYGDADRF